MTATPAGYLLRYLRHLPSDRERVADDIDLLKRFAKDRDERAFAELFRRHGKLVWSTCLRVLGNATAAEDAFQATFLLLVRRATSLGRAGSLAGWRRSTTARLWARRSRAQRVGPPGEWPRPGATGRPARP